MLRHTEEEDRTVAGRIDFKNHTLYCDDGRNLKSIEKVPLHVVCKCKVRVFSSYYHQVRHTYTDTYQIYES